MPRKRANQRKDEASGADGPTARAPAELHKPRRNYARWRAVTLSLVYVVFALHIIHWRVSGKTLAPLELNEVMYTLELGVITAGFLFMCLLVLGTLIFGRFFCSWACHIMVLQDLCGWLLRRIGIRAKPIRARLFLLIPPLTALYMFVWPQLVRAWESRALPTFHLATDAQGWASFSTTNFWRNLPGPWIIALTFLVCGFAIVYLLGSRTFCTYVCPYGAVFALADRFSPGKILVNDRCQQCARCTAACTSGVRVHDEIRLHKMVVNPACLKDLDCVAACPQQALRYGFARPALFKSYKSGGRFGIPYEFSWIEETLMAGVFLVVLLSTRGLYARIPFLLSLAMGVIAGFLAVVTMRLFVRTEVSLARWKLKSLGRLRRIGYAYMMVASLAFAFVVHSAFIRYHEYAGLRGAFALRENDDATQKASVAHATLDHFRFVERWGLFRNERIEREWIDVAAALDQDDDLDRLIVRYLNRHPNDGAVHLLKARRLAEQGLTDEAVRHYRWITEHEPESASGRRIIASAHAALGALDASRGDFAAAAASFERSLRFDASRADVHADLGSTLAELGRIDEAIHHLQLAVQSDPALARARYNLATLLGHIGRDAEALDHYLAAAEQLSADADVMNNLGATLLRMGRIAEARTYLTRAITLNAEHADAHFNLGALFTAIGDSAGADAHFRRAVHLDRRYADFLNQQ